MNREKLIHKLILLLIAFQSGHRGVPALRNAILVPRREHVLLLDSQGGVAPVHLLLHKPNSVVQSMEDVTSFVTMEFALARQATLNQVLQI